jgi:ubiquinone/menaquinone biosynthesis C-methylase UbiE
MIRRPDSTSLTRPPRPHPAGLLRRYSLPDGAVSQAWQRLYAEDPELYESLTEGEPLHPMLFRQLPIDGAVVVEIGAGTGRLTLPCATRAKKVYAVEPMAGMRAVLSGKLRQRGVDNVVVLEGRAERLPLADALADICVSASAFGADPAFGGEAGLGELLRVTRPGGSILILWPDKPAWFKAHGFQHQMFSGPMEVRFRDLDTARRCAELFYGAQVRDYLEAHRRPIVPFSVLGVNAPRDLCRLSKS